MKKTRIGALIGALFPSIAGAIPVVTDLGAMPDQTSLILALLAANPWPATSFNTATNTASFTATPQQVMSGQDTVLFCSGTAGAGVALTLPTVASLIPTLTAQQAVVGSSTCFRIMNSTSQTITVTTNTGWTLNGTMTIPTAAFRDFFVTLTNVGTTPTAFLQDVGTGNGTTQ